MLVGALVSLTLGAYSRNHVPTGRPISTFGFTTLLDMKVWLATAALALAFVQVGTALRIYGRVGHGPCPRAVVITHRVAGVVAVALTLPVAFHCMWSLGFGTYDTRVARPLPDGVRVLRDLRHQDAGGQEQSTTRLGLAFAWRCFVHGSGHHLDNLFVVVLHRTPTDVLTLCWAGWANWANPEKRRRCLARACQHDGMLGFVVVHTSQVELAAAAAVLSLACVVGAVFARTRAPAVSVGLVTALIIGVITFLITLRGSPHGVPLLVLELASIGLAVGGFLALSTSPLLPQLDPCDVQRRSLSPLLPSLG